MTKILTLSCCFYKISRSPFKNLIFLLLILVVLEVRSSEISSEIPPGAFERALEVVENLHTASSEPEPLTLHPDFDYQQADCSGFIRSSGEVGPKGEYILDGLARHSRLDILINPPETLRGIKDLCPDFFRMKTETKNYFYVWTLAAIAWGESRCYPDRKNPNATNSKIAGPAVGLLQLEDRRHVRSWRGPLCAVPSVRPVRENLLCGLEILRGQYDGTYGPHGMGLLARNSHWQYLRSPRSRVAHLIKLFPGCYMQEQHEGRSET